MSPTPRHGATAPPGRGARVAAVARSHPLRTGVGLAAVLALVVAVVVVGGGSSDGPSAARTKPRKAAAEHPRPTDLPPASGPAASSNTAPATAPTTPAPTTLPPPVVNPDFPSCQGCPIAPLTGLPTPADQFDRPALAVKIDNHNCCARPQVGINDADIVIEERVEGAITRFLAVFNSKGSIPVGDIRSARTTDLYLLPMFNHPLLAFSGGNDYVQQAVAGSPDVVNLGAQLGQNEHLYARDPSREIPYNYYSRTDWLWAAAPGPQRPSPIFTYRAPGEAPAHAEPTNGVRMSYLTPVDYRWNGTGWRRIQGLTDHVDARGTVVTPANVVVLFVQYGTSPADSRSPEAQLLGGGQAWVFTNGVLVRGTWTRPSTASPPRLTDTTGAEIRLTPGRTWIELVDGATLL